jgi:elongation factor G
MEATFPIGSIRNIGFIAHIDAGKTTVTEQVLFATGRIHRAGGVDDGNTAMDWMPQEKERGITITAAATTTYWKDHRINVIDTPGHVDFTAEVERSLRVLDGGIVVLDAVAGVQSQSETVWRQADTYNVPRLCFVNKMDRVGASFERTIESIRRRLSGNPVAIQLPIGAEDEFAGMIDLITGKATMYPVGRVNEGIAEQPDDVDRPPEYDEQYNEYRQAMIEKIVETDEGLLLQYLEEKEIAPEDLTRALRQATIDRKIVPVMCGSAMFAKGVHNLLDGIITYLPSPADVPAVEGINPKTDEIEIRNPDASEPLAALAFKVATDPYVGRLVFLRVYSGTVKAGAVVNNVTKNGRERMGRLLRMHANSREELEEVTAGNICAAIGLKNTFTGDTIGLQDGGIILEPPKFPKPVVSVAVEPSSKADQDRLTDALRKLADEDPTFLVSVNDETGQTIISGMGELHLEVLVDRMRREFSVVAQVGMPRVSYRETLTVAREVEGRFVRQTGGHGQFGHVVLELTPLDRGEGIIFENKITRGAIPREFIPAVEKGVRDALDNGPLAGYPLVDLKVTLVDGSFHQVDSSELAFRSAGMLAIREGAGKCSPVLLEPISDLEVVTPGEYLGDVIGDLGTRRAQILSVEGQEDLQSVRALLPLGETFSYTTALRSISQGRASYSMEFKYYEPVPDHIVKTLVTA